MKYEILLSDSLDGLEEIVRDYLDNGYTLAGGLVVHIQADGETWYYQAVFKSE
jgi:hypothetical protein